MFTSSQMTCIPTEIYSKVSTESTQQNSTHWSFHNSILLSLSQIQNASFKKSEWTHFLSQTHTYGYTMAIKEWVIISRVPSSLPPSRTPVVATSWRRTLLLLHPEPGNIKHKRSKCDHSVIKITVQHPFLSVGIMLLSNKWQTLLSNKQVANNHFYKTCLRHYCFSSRTTVRSFHKAHMSTVKQGSQTVFRASIQQTQCLQKKRHTTKHTPSTH